MVHNRTQIKNGRTLLALVVLTNASFALVPQFAIAEDKRYIPFWMKNAPKPATTAPQAQSKAAQTSKQKPAAGAKGHSTTNKSPSNYQANRQPARKSMEMEDPNNSMWLDISAANSLSYPIPLFNGKRTKIMKTTEGALFSTSMYGRQVVLQTRDSAYDVYLWYKKMLPTAGYQLNEKYPAKALFGTSYMVRGDSHSDQAIISINPQDDEYGPCTHIQVSTAPKHNVENSFFH